MSDTYPGWDDFSKLLQELLKKAKDDGDKIAKKLADAAAQARHKCDCDSVTQAQIKEALKNPQGKDYDWSHWAGNFDGKWYGDKEYEDPQRWDEPEPCESGHENAMPGVPAGKKCKKQDVRWYHPKNSSEKGGRVARALRRV